MLKDKWERIKFIYWDDISEPLDVEWISRGEDLDNPVLNCEIPKIIWIFWNSDKPSHLVNICIHQIKKLHPDFEINILDFNNLHVFLNDFPKFKENTPIANISDYIRLALILKYGGIYLDASIFLTENLHWILDKAKEYDAFLFYTDMFTTDINHPISENWLIASHANNRFIKDWLNEYSQCIFSDNPESYYQNIYGNNNYIQKLPKIAYLNSYVSAIKILRENEYRIIYARSGSVGHYYEYKYFLEGRSVIADILLLKNKKSITIPKLIKFTKDSRRAMDCFLDKKLFKRHSLIGEVAFNYFKHV